MAKSGFSTLDDWIAREAIAFAVDSPASLNVAVDRVVADLGDSIELLGIGEPTHLVEDFLILRNRVFQRLVEAHGFSAIAVESSFPRGRAANEYVAGRGGDSFEAVQEAGFSHGFGRMAANRELVEWMRGYNAEAGPRVKLQFYGFDSPTEMTGTDSPRQLLEFGLGYFESIDRERGQEHRKRIEPLLGKDAAWENPAAMMDPTKSIGLSPAARALRIATEDLITEMTMRRPELAGKSSEEQYLEAAHYLRSARWLLDYHALLARQSDRRLVESLGLRDLMMAENLAYIVAREAARKPGGNVLAFAHNAHLQRGQARWQWGPQLLQWWPAGAHLNEMLREHYAVIGVGVGLHAAMGAAQPEPGTLEARLAAVGKPAALIPTHHGEGLPAAEIATLPKRSASATYFPFTSESLADFDWLAVLN